MSPRLALRHPPLSAHLAWLVLAAISLMASPALALGFPIERAEERWTPVDADQVAVSSLRLELSPARDPSSEAVVWWVDETMVIRNYGIEAVRLDVAVPNAWSARDVVAGDEVRDFWAEAYVNGRAQPTELVSLVANPAHASVSYRVARRLRLDLGPGESAHVRLVFALPLERTDLDEHRLRFPFHLRTLWDGPIEAGTIVLRWSGQLFGLRTNLPAYSQYRDRVEWFVRGFEPTTDLDVRFLSRAAVFQMVATELGCPMPWELVDRVADGDPTRVRAMLGGYVDDQLELCAELPAALQGSEASAERAGLLHLDLSQFAPEGTALSGPLVVPDPTFEAEQLSDSERLYSRFLRQELQLRREEAGDAP